jgi:ABC-type Mn2+/Zn2+ transport system ATPase subunit
VSTVGTVGTAGVMSEAPLRVWRRGRLLVDGAEGLRVGPGDIVALRGDNGAGKSSILLGCLGLLPSTLTVRGQIGYVPQQVRSSVALPLNLADTLRLVGVPGRQHEAVVAAAALNHATTRPWQALSTGERMRLLVARAIHSRAEVLLLDEPTASLDPDSRQRVLSAIAAAAVAGAAVLLVSHNDDDIAALGARAVAVVAAREAT